EPIFADDLEEFDHARETVAQLSAEYRAAEKDDYITGGFMNQQPSAENAASAIDTRMAPPPPPDAVTAGGMRLRLQGILSIQREVEATLSVMCKHERKIRFVAAGDDALAALSRLYYEDLHKP
ncbi:Tubulin gamma-1 chain, partial [Perkinsus olseni]